MEEEVPGTERGLDVMKAMMKDEKEETKQTVDIQGYSRFLHMSFWQQYFDVSQEEVMKRVSASIKPVKPDFQQLTKNKPDLYGPFWILTTLIVWLSMTGNLARFFRHFEHAKFEFHLEYVRYAVSFIYGYGIVFSNIIWLTLYLFKSNTKPIDVMCLYGYSLSSFLGICLICIIPSPVLHWLLAAYGTLNSTALIISNLQSEV